MLLKQILVPLDGSVLADRVLLHLRRLLLRKDTNVLLLRVIDEAPPRHGEERGFAGAHLDDQRRRLESLGARVETRIAKGDPAAEILRCAAERPPSLIAMSTHGRSGFDRWIWGTVAERLLREAQQPLFLLNPRALPEATHANEGGFKRILAPIDGSEIGATVLPLVSTIARLYESEVVLFHAAPPAEATTAVEEEAIASLNRHRKELEAQGLRARVEMRTESAAIAILDAAEAEEVDLVAMTAHGSSGSARWAFGSVAEKVLRHAPCPILVKRGAGRVE